jgi:RNA polymerase subunit RPABC4/transcription elongation factor Spt4
MYYIYHIPGIKIGCSKNPKRRIKAQGYTEFIILETHTDIQIASEREISLQKEYGLKVDNTLYKQTISSPTIEGIKKGGQNGVLKKWIEENPEEFKKNQKIAAKLGGLKQGPIRAKINKENGHMSQLGKQMTIYNNRLQICPYCGKESKGVGYSRWHGENCKSK